MNWHRLDSPSTESLVYLACWEPRSQNEVVRWIYGPVFPTNIRPVIRARRALQELGYIEILQDSQDLRKIRLVSKPQPFVLFAENKLTTRKSLRGKQSLSQDERTVLLRILDSKWFRQSFVYDLDYKKGDWLAPTLRTRLSSQSALRTIAEFVEEICAMSEVLALPRGLSGNQPSLRAVLDAVTFDAFMKEWSAVKLESDPAIPEVLERAAARLRSWLPSDERLDMLIQNSLAHPSFPLLCIPTSLAQKLSTIGRVPLTLTLYLMQAIEK